MVASTSLINSLREEFFKGMLLPVTIISLHTGKKNLFVDDVVFCVHSVVFDVLSYTCTGTGTCIALATVIITTERWWCGGKEGQAI